MGYVGQSEIVYGADSNLSADQNICNSHVVLRREMEELLVKLFSSEFVSPFFALPIAVSFKPLFLFSEIQH